MIEKTSYFINNFFCYDQQSNANPTNIYLFKVNNRNTRKKSEICSGVFIVNFETYLTSFSSVSIVEFEQVNVSWKCLMLTNNTTTVICNSHKFEISWCLDENVFVKPVYCKSKFTFPKSSKFDFSPNLNLAKNSIG